MAEPVNAVEFGASCMLILHATGYTAKKRLAIFPSPAGMSPTKLSPVGDGKIANLSYCGQLCFFCLKYIWFCYCPLEGFNMQALTWIKLWLLDICKKKSFYMLQNAARTICKWKHVEAPQRYVTCQGLYFNTASSLFHSREAILVGFVKSHSSTKQTNTDQLKEKRKKYKFLFHLLSLLDLS